MNIKHEDKSIQDIKDKMIKHLEQNKIRRIIYACR